MNKILTFILYMILLGILTLGHAMGQSVTIPREVAEYYYKQKIENDNNKQIVSLQRRQLDLKDEQIVEYKSIQELCERDKELFEGVNKNNEQIIQIQLKENKRLKKKLRINKIKNILVAAVLTGLLIIK